MLHYRIEEICPIPTPNLTGRSEAQTGNEVRSWSPGEEYGLGSCALR